MGGIEIMSFENGYNIKDYVGSTIEKFKDDDRIFDKCLKVLNIYIVRQDWPYCYTEYKKAVSKIIEGDIENLVHYIEQFSSQAKQGHELLQDWDKELPKSFKEECEVLVDIIMPIVNQYYDFTNNPLGIDRVIQIDRQEYKNLVRIRRIDGEVLDLNLSSWDIKNLSKALLDMVKEE
jgi:hypothetical protein